MPKLEVSLDPKAAHMLENLTKAVENSQVRYEIPCTKEHLDHNDQTMEKVRVAIKQGAIGTILTDDAVTEIIGEMQYRGIFFREREVD